MADEIKICSAPVRAVLLVLVVAQPLAARIKPAIDNWQNQILLLVNIECVLVNRTMSGWFCGNESVFRKQTKSRGNIFVVPR